MRREKGRIDHCLRFPAVLRHRELRFGHRSIQSPVIWLGHDQKHPFRVWKYLDSCDGIMVSAHQFLERPGFYRLAATEGIHGAMEHSGLVFLDSGGYQFQRSKECRITAADVLSMNKQLRPDLGAVLDVPLNPEASSSGNWRRWQKTLKYTAYMHQNNGCCTLVPVIHTYSLEAVERRCQELIDVFPEPSLVAIGSLVPLIRGNYLGRKCMTRNGSRLTALCQRWRFMAQLILRLRGFFGKTPLHVFGAGALSTIYLLVLLGVDSVDSASWRLKAAYGAVYLPGAGEIYPNSVISRQRTRPHLSKEAKSLLEDCRCPVCAE
jgi:queuine/archaeosine tRNA-ribosyltransferase